ncbi:MAG: hypothetical protein A2107_07105 [Verrucomicrobia bacterium GWF2_62_7]|nr:MAG: hypothetical protein A2107_07105 [Verrucomicrobia bacterium GWF2_62_7]
MKKTSSRQDKILAEYDKEPAYHMPRRKDALVLLTLRVPREVKRKLASAARQRGLSGYTTVARDLIERGLRTASDTPPAHIKELARLTAREVVSRLRQSATR